MTIPQGGCTAIGAAIGSSIHRPTGRMETVPAVESWKLASGVRVVLVLRDGRRVEGVVDSVGWRVGSKYAEAYRRFQEANARGRLLPDLGPADLVGEGESRPQRVDFLGLDPRGVIVRRGFGVPERVHFLTLTSLTAGDRVADGSMLRDLALAGQVPLLTEIRLAKPPNEVALDDIASLERPAMKSEILQGAATGLMLDAAVAYFLAMSLKNSGLGFNWP